MIAVSSAPLGSTSFWVCDLLSIIALRSTCLRLRQVSASAAVDSSAFFKFRPISASHATFYALLRRAGIVDHSDASTELRDKRAHKADTVFSKECMNENTGPQILTDIHTHVILISHDTSRARLGWISASTGLTYCGICLRSSVTPETGKSCPACRARVAYVFDYYSSPEALRHAWKEISMQRSAKSCAAANTSSRATGAAVASHEDEALELSCQS